MYRDYFSLNALPFSNTPDPRFFFNTPDHEEALASLLYVANERKGFALVTGEVGTGKTLLSRMLLSRLPAGSRTALVSQTGGGGLDILRAICDEFQLDLPPDAAPSELTRTLEDFLLEQYARDRLAVVILDEAQTLNADAFEQVRLLGNLESEDAKLLQVLILGQPETHDILNRGDLRQFRQRIFRTYNLHAMSAVQTSAYIQHRLDVAGAAGRQLFTDEALRLTAEHSHGLPRVINQICDNALLTAYGQGAQSVCAAIIRETIDQIPGCFTVPTVKPVPAAPMAADVTTTGRQVDLAEATRAAEHQFARMIAEGARRITSTLDSDRSVLTAELAVARNDVAALRTALSDMRLMTQAAAAAPPTSLPPTVAAEATRVLASQQAESLHATGEALQTALERSAAATRAEFERALSAARETMAQLESRRAAFRAEYERYFESAASRATDLRNGLVDSLAEAKRRTTGTTGEIDAAVARGLAQLNELRSAIEVDIGALGRDAFATIERAQRESQSAAAHMDAAVTRGNEESERIRQRTSRAIADGETKVGEMARRAEETVARLDQTLTAATSDTAALRGELESEAARARAAIQSLRIDADETAVRAAQACDDLSARADAVISQADERLGIVRQDGEQQAALAGERLAAIAQRAAANAQDAQLDADRIAAHLAEQLDTHQAATRAAFARLTSESTDAMSAHRDALAQQISAACDTLAQQSDAAIVRISEEFERRTSVLTDRTAQLEARSAKLIRAADTATTHLDERAIAIRTEIGAMLESAAARGQSLVCDINARHAALRDEAESLSTTLREMADTAALGLRDETNRTLIESTAQRESAATLAKSWELRLVTLCERMERESSQSHKETAAMLDETRRTAAELAAQAEQLTARAQSNAERLQSAGRTVLDDAQSTADRLRETAVDRSRRNEATVSDLRRQAETLRDETQRNADLVTGEASRISSETRTAQSRADELLVRADGIQQQTQRLLTLPQEIIGEAKHQTETLAVLSKSMQAAIAKLTQVAAQAEQRGNQLSAHAHQRATLLTEATRHADARLAEITASTGRMTQLIGIVRQMYSTNIQIEQMRERMGLAAESAISQTLPRLVEPARTAAIKPAPQTAGTIIRTPAPASKSANQTKPAQPTLGDLAKKNTKLNEWLRKTIEDADTATPVETNAA